MPSRRNTSAGRPRSSALNTATRAVNRSRIVRSFFGLSEIVALPAGNERRQFELGSELLGDAFGKHRDGQERIYAERAWN